MGMNRIGIDAGGTLLKTAHRMHGEMVTRTFQSEQMEECLNWLEKLGGESEFFITGGKGAHIQANLSGQTQQLDEFTATINGTRYLIEEEGHEVSNYIVVSIGTGTSFYHVTPQSFQRLFGSGIGGGTLIGLGSLLSNKETNFSSLVASAENGDEKESDLLIRDIYAPGPAPLMGDLTAANFGKAHLNQEATSHDHMASLVRLLAETILLLSIQAAQAHHTKSLVFIGSTLEDNPPLKRRLKMFEESFDYQAIFLEKGAHAGAIGAMLG
ncbi:type II pantothenate kinase [Oceanobacillus picturae]|uniref:Type II pantothenate kinase n=2 Tax=Oceanobacillus picturae TaxID=171693 RepID=A0A0U9H996_9BACI|nr:type II pantothenate kinase [Oceanobacillus picturae]GAQ19071.1 type II pantothenate kinase [Oceanobacillus picturae]